MKRQFIISLIAKYDLANTRRKEEEVYKRYYIYYMLSRIGMGSSAIAREFKKDHASVIHGIKQHKKWYKLNDQRYLNAIKILVDEVEMYDNNLHFIPVNIRRRGEKSDITFTLEFDEEIVHIFEDKLTLNELITRLISIRSLIKV